MINAIDVAEFFTKKSDSEITQAKLHALAYYAQGYSLGIFGKPLFSERIEAWESGSVVTHMHTVQRKPIEDLDTVKLLNAIWRTYGTFSAGMLSRMTYADPPYQEAFRRGSNTEITHESMQAYFQTRTNDLNLEGRELSIEEIFGTGVALTEREA